MPQSGRENGGSKRGPGKAWLFLACVVAAYLVVLAASPPRAMAALRASGRVLLQIALPLCLAFGVMVLLNAVVRPAHITRFLGRGAGAMGAGLSSAAGILSMGPIFAWYPLLRDLRERGASDFHLANFLCCRAVKPFLLPLMAFYFGCAFTVVFNLLIVLGALLVAAVVSALAGRAAGA